MSNFSTPPAQPRLETLSIHGGRQVDPSTGAVVSPIHLSTTFERDAEGHYHHGYIYTRSGNPNRMDLEACLSLIEGGKAAIAFSSGAAATTAVFQTLSPTDHVIAPQDVYHGTANILRHVMAPWGLQVDFVDMADLEAIAAAIRPQTKLIWIETPSNPLLRITNIAAVAELAHRHRMLCVCDSTWCTPAIQRPLALGCDAVVHSTTKYLGGHSDLLGGAVIVPDETELFQQLRTLQTLNGAVPSPFDCWLLLRGIQTLAYRMQGHCDNGEAIAQFLYQHPAVHQVHYPGLSGHPQHKTAAQQMARFGGMVSVQMRGGKAKAFELIKHLKYFTRATSLGGVHSLIEHRASIEGPESQTPQDLLRISVGLEHTDDLLADLAQGLEQI
ncbi:MAG: aminotransferase class I/II-fold pyridoxal phosphate-dependent enzyme [Cyanobacteria bacterium P01_D01_bin.128]